MSWRSCWCCSPYSIIQLWGRPIHHNASLRTIPVTDRPESDGAKARQFMRDRSLTLNSAMLYHRLVAVVDENARNELMSIRLEKH